MAYPADEILVERIRQGDQKALEMLYERYYYALCDFSVNFIRSTALAEEIVSDVFLAIWLKRQTLGITSSFKSYLFVAVRNQSLNYLQQNKRVHDDIAALDTTVEMSPSGADSGIRYAELENEIESIIEKLPALRRAIFRLNRMEGLRYKEIAEILSIPVNTVQKQMILAVKYISQFHPQIRENYAALLLAFLTLS